ncbi:hypothetical protein [Amycolatopsis japonica]|uniref:hypothetical protein n=1 Tax=Amycolatopsis TaxID=1813 RepID=UPI001E2A8CD4|nr:hypothetical protein [Amycolatopsis japonica]
MRHEKVDLVTGVGHISQAVDPASFTTGEQCGLAAVEHRRGDLLLARGWCVEEKDDAG